MPHSLHIGEVATRTGRSVHAIRWYEAQGLVPGVERDGGGRRVYTEHHVGWLEFMDRLRGTGDADTAAVNIVLTNVVEYAILEWLAKPQVNVGWDDIGTIYMLQGSIGGGGIPIVYQAVLVGPNPDEYNALVKRRPISIVLPPGSAVLRRGEHERTIEVRTRHSYVRIALSMRGGSVFNAATNPAAATLQKALHLSPTAPPSWVAALMANVETGQYPVGRFSKAAKLEAAWLDRIRARFETDFSWDRLRQRLHNAQ